MTHKQPASTRETLILRLRTIRTSAANVRRLPGAEHVAAELETAVAALTRALTRIE
jgi:hypothetical protein